MELRTRFYAKGFASGTRLSRRSQGCQGMCSSVCSVTGFVWAWDVCGPNDRTDAQSMCLLTCLEKSTGGVVATREQRKLAVGPGVSEADIRGWKRTLTGTQVSSSASE